MSTSSRLSYVPHRRLQSHSRSAANRRTGGGSLSVGPITRDDAYTYALRVAYLHYLLQPKSKRKQYVPAPKPAPGRTRQHTGIGHLVAEFAPGSSNSLKLPHGFRLPLEKRLMGILQGVEKQPGYNDSAVKRSFAEAYTAFTEKSFSKTLDKERKVEPMILMFYSSAVKGAQKVATDDSWKPLPDRHTALFVRLLSSIVRDMGQERERAELMSRLAGLEKKLLTDEDLAEETSGMTTVEVITPLSYHIKDMPMVLTVARIFGVSPEQAQEDLNAHRQLWTEDAALRDLVSYQQRLASGMAGALRSDSFDLEETWQAWKKSESKFVTDMILEVFAAKPGLKKSSHSGPGPDMPAGAAGRPQSMMYSDDKPYAMLSDAFSGDQVGLGLGALSLDQPSTIRNVDEPNYTFVPHNTRAYYKAVLLQAVNYDLAHAEPVSDPDAPWGPLSPRSHELMMEVAARWRVPQSSRLVAFVEVIGTKFDGGEIGQEQLDQALEFIKTPVESRREGKRPFIQHYHEGLATLPRTAWTTEDFTTYALTLNGLHVGLLRDLHGLLVQCYEAAPTIGVVMHNILTHILCDPAFTENAGDMEHFAEELSRDLRQRAEAVYRTYLDNNLPGSPDDWNFLHIVNLGKAVTKLCEKIRKRYAKNPQVMGVDPLAVLVEIVFPCFEEDTNAIIQRILQSAKEKGVDVNMEDGFDLYKEMCSIRRIHGKFLPRKPFAFNVEELLVEFVWRFIGEADKALATRVDEAIKLDPFEVRNQDREQEAGDDDRHSSSIVDMFMLFNATVTQVKALGWENEVHQAKFMTGLSKSFAAGIGRYCEVVESKFSKEMDRLSAQEAAAVAQQKSAQERFFQYAKEAWNNKEKPEPFQFYPTSFVKLNNIEYALQQMDKLEAAMGIDQCIEILARYEAPKLQARRPSNFVFTVKIVEAEDLRACDPTGSSDPYVILGDEYRKRLYKSRIMHKTLNPKWDESVDVAARGAVNLVVTIWDWDTFGDHDCVGRTALKLDPVHFKDYLPQEFWLDLDTQGRILLRVSMEGERDDIDFYFGKAFRHLKRAERDMVRKITEKLSAQINETLSRDTLRSLLRTGGGGIGSSVASLWKKTPAAAAAPPTGPGNAEIDQALLPLLSYFNENFAIMNQTLARVTMDAVMARLWKEVLMAIESLVVPPLSEKPSSQKPLGQRELDIVFAWLGQLFEFFNAKDDAGRQLGVRMDVLKSPKYLELFSLNFFYFDDTQSLVRESERIATAAAQRAQQALMQTNAGSHLANHRISAPPNLSPGFMPQGLTGGTPFASLGTIRRGKSVSLARNLGTMRRVKEQRRKEAQAEPTDDMILRILRMRPEAAGYLKERHRQKERQAATAAAAMIVQNSVNQGWNSNLAIVGPYPRNSLVPRR